MVLKLNTILFVWTVYEFSWTTGYTEIFLLWWWLFWLIATSLFNSISHCNSKVVCKCSQQNYTFLKILKSILTYTENEPLAKALLVFWAVWILSHFINYLCGYLQGAKISDRKGKYYHHLTTWYRLLFNSLSNLSSCNGIE